jgi:hypothetical protein
MWKVFNVLGMGVIIVSYNVQHIPDMLKNLSLPMCSTSAIYIIASKKLFNDNNTSILDKTILFILNLI